MGFHNYDVYFVNAYNPGVQLVQSTSHFPLFSQNISYVFLLLQNFKISFPSVFTVYFVLAPSERQISRVVSRDDDLCCKQTRGHSFSATYCTCTKYTRYFKFALVYKCYFPFAV